MSICRTATGRPRYCKRDRADRRTLVHRHPDALAEIVGLAAGQALHLIDVPFEKIQDCRVALSTLDVRLAASRALR